MFTKYKNHLDSELIESFISHSDTNIETDYLIKYHYKDFYKSSCQFAIKQQEQIINELQKLTEEKQASNKNYSLLLKELEKLNNTGVIDWFELANGEQLLVEIYNNNADLLIQESEVLIILLDTYTDILDLDDLDYDNYFSINVFFDEFASELGFNLPPEGDDYINIMVGSGMVTKKTKQISQSLR